MTLEIPPLTAEVRRGEIVESIHQGLFAAVDDSGRLLASCGDPNVVTTLRSAAKPLQAIPLVTLPGAENLDLRDEELAICCASHPGTPRHSALAASVLSISGFNPDDLVCGAPSEGISPLRHGCSGNHAAILTAAHLMRAPLTGYERADHPAQLAIRDIVADMSGSIDMRIATDGCGIPTFGLRLRENARTFAALCRAGAPWERIPQAMGAYPELIGSAEWIDVRLIQVTGGRIVAKTGAEGVLCVGLRGAGKGLAVKVLDGSTRTLGLFAIEALLRLGWISDAEASSPDLDSLRYPRIKDSTGEIVGEIVLVDGRSSSGVGSGLLGDSSVIPPGALATPRDRSWDSP